VKRLFIVALVIFGIGIIAGCAQRKVAPPPEQQKQTEAKQEQKTEPSGTITIKPAPQEAVTEKLIAKAKPAETLISAKELQTKLEDIHFDFDKYDIKDEAKPVLKELSDIVSKTPNIKVVIEGHCDERGTNEYNLGLGDRRANSTKEYLMSLGIASGRIETISYGEEKPLCTESTEVCWAKNRRAHFVLIEESK
jgi:peptidoglycan-associated lipoprotein